MKDDTKRWLDYADENLDSARVLPKSDFYNACLQNFKHQIVT